MTRLRRTPNSGYSARKGTPTEVRDAYLAAHGKRQEERFSRPSTVPQSTAESEFDDWKAEVNSRISGLRAQARGEGEPTLLPRQARALAGDWYTWFVAQHEADPGTPEQWEAMGEAHDELCLRFDPRDQNSDLLQEAEPRSPRACKQASGPNADRRANTLTILACAGSTCGSDSH